MPSGRTRNGWVKSMKPRETAQDVLDRMIDAYTKHKKKKSKLNSKNSYSIREFSFVDSMDINGIDVISPVFTLGLRNIATLVDETMSNKLKSASYTNYCNQIEITLGAPNLPKMEVKDTLKLRTSDEIKNRLEKFLKREKFELKILRDICQDIKVTQNLETKSSIFVLKWLYNGGTSPSQEEIVNELRLAIIDRERDKLFYIRRHPQQAMLHRCNNDAIIARVLHLAWVFVKGNPFNKELGVNGAISRPN